jgi:hypothetical protein
VSAIDIHASPARRRSSSSPFIAEVKTAGRAVQSDFLYASPTFLVGMASSLDLFGVFERFNTSRTSAEADLLALICDRRVVRDDIRNGVQKVLRESGLHPNQLALDIDDAKLAGLR